MSKDSAHEFLKKAASDDDMRREVFKLVQELDAQGILDYAKKIGHDFDFTELVQAYKDLRKQAPPPDPKVIEEYIKAFKDATPSGLEEMYLINDYLIPPYLSPPGETADYLISDYLGH